MGRHAAAPRVGWMLEVSAITAALFALLLAMLDLRRPPGRRRMPRRGQARHTTAQPPAPVRRPSPRPTAGALTDTRAAQ